MYLQDHNIVVEDEGILFRARVTAAALDALQRRAGCRQCAMIVPAPIWTSSSTAPPGNICRPSSGFASAAGGPKGLGSWGHRRDG